MKTWTLLLAAVLLVGCEQGQNVGNDSGGGAGEGGGPSTSGCTPRSCGQRCFRCPANIPDCTDPTEIGYCNVDGACAVQAVDCTPFTPCVACGDACSTPAYEGFCSADGVCLEQQATCP
jgi:hypothetical protein